MQRRWSFKDNESAMGEHGWYNGNSGGQAHPAGQKKPNPADRGEFLR